MKHIIECPVKRQKVNKSYHCPNYECDGYCIYKPIEKKNRHAATQDKIKDSIPKAILDLYKEQFKEQFGHIYLLALLAYPKLSDYKHSLNFITSVESEIFKGASEISHFKMSGIADKFRTYEKRKAERNIEHTLKRIIDRRLLAAWIALNYMNRPGTSLNDIVDHITKKKEYSTFKLCSNKTNIMKDIWTESKTVLHIAMAVFPMLHNIYAKDIKPDLDITYNLVKQIKKNKKLSISALCIIPGKTAKRLNIKDKFELLKPGWLDDILQVAEVYYDLLPAMIPFLNKEDLIKLS